MQLEYENHIKNKNLSREMKDFDKGRAKSNDELCVACFDLQQVLPTPHSNESIMYYTRKLCTFNLSVYDLGTKEGYAYIWHEGISGRGANEVATCIYKFLQAQSIRGKKEIILYSDNCGGQNRNRYFLTMLSYAKKVFNFTKIEHKFLERGHTQNENDSVHATIEHKSKHLSIYTTPQWAATIQMARASSPYQVIELASSDFLDFKCIAEAVPNFGFDNDGGKIKWMKIKVVTIKGHDNNTVKLVYSDQTSACLNLGVRFSSTRAAKSKSKTFSLPDVQPLYGVKSPPKIAASKYKSLVCLCRKNIIPEVHHQFYFNLRHESE